MLWFRIVPILLLIVINTLVHAFPLLVVTMFKAVLPSERARRACNPLLLWFAEHWIVVRGTARVTRNNDVFELFANQSTYIPIGAKHRLENPGEEMLELIEVQSGDYLGEDDIVRYEDVYGRG